MSKVPHFTRGKRVAASPAPIEPAIEASADRAAIERDIAIVEEVAPPIVPAADLPDDHTAVLPEPTLVAEPGAPQPIVTASPILAAEPSAIDVVQADAAIERGEAGIGPAPDREPAHDAAAGQPTLTIEGPDAARVAHALADGALSGATIAAHEDERRPVAALSMMDDLTCALQRLMDVDPTAYGELLNRLGVGRASDRPDLENELESLKADDFVAFLALLDRVDPSRGVRSAADAAARDMPIDGPTFTVVEVVGPAAGRRRAGMTFGPVARHFLLEDLTADQLTALQGDRLLAVGIRQVAEADVPDTLFPSG